MFRYAIICILVLTMPAFAEEKEKKEQDLVDKLQSISVTITTDSGSGSGVLFTRKDGDETRTFTWTAGHVISGLRKQREIVVNGDTKKVVEFKDASVVNEFHQNGRRIGEMKLDARVIRYSDAENGEDIALLEVRKRDFVPEGTSAEFYDGEIPKIGTELYHVGSLLGQMGANSLTTGVVSQIGRVLDLGANGKTFDQTTVTAFPGSSGGGVFLKSNGKCVGLLVRGAGEQFNMIVPVRRLREWAKRSGVEWAMNKEIKIPSDEDLRKLPPEDSGSVVGSSAKDASKESSVEINKKFPFLIAK